jgi:hypothetical protein
LPSLTVHFCIVNSLGSLAWCFATKYGLAPMIVEYLAFEFLYDIQTDELGSSDAM